MSYNINGADFLDLALLLSLKYIIMGFFIPTFSNSESLSLENLLPSTLFFLKWLTILSLTPICLRNVKSSSTENFDTFPSFGMVISCSGINLEITEKNKH